MKDPLRGVVVAVVRILKELALSLNEWPVAHYTRQEVLLKIAKSDESFRLYNTAHMRDHTEGHFIFNKKYLGKGIKKALYGDESSQENHVYIGSFVRTANNEET